MNKRDLKKKISDSFIAETPDLKDKILSSCKEEDQIPAPMSKKAGQKAIPMNIAVRRIAACAACLALFVSGLSLGWFIPNKTDVTDSPAPETETFVFLDVNPSIELRISKDDKIIECIAGNDDAKLILADLKLEGVDTGTALTAIVGSMYVNGYLANDSNSILVSVATKNETRSETFLNDITKKINSVFERSEMECSIIAQNVELKEELKQRADENGISVGKMHLVDKMVDNMDEYDENDAPNLANMSIRDLNLIYSTRQKKEEAKDPFENDVASGNVGGVIDRESILSMLLSELNIKTEDIEHYEIKAKMHTEESRRVIYSVFIKPKNHNTAYLFEVDCSNGDIIKRETKTDKSDDREGEDHTPPNTEGEHEPSYRDDHGDPHFPEIN